MAQDYAKKKPAQQSRRKPKVSARKPAPTSNAPWKPFTAGTAFGVFLSFLVWLGINDQPPAEEISTPGKATTAKSERTPSAEPSFEFWNLAEEDIQFPREDPEFEVSEAGNFLLQVGSFKRMEDADRQRAQLILLGMEPRISESNGDNGHWYRVQIGPFETKSRLQQVRALLAEQNIDTLLLKRR